MSVTMFTPTTADIGAVVRFTATFKSTGSTNADPTNIGFLYDTPSSTAPSTATRTSTGIDTVSGISRASTGVYYFDITTTGKGLYEGRFVGDTPVVASGESWFSVRPRRVTT